MGMNGGLYEDGWRVVCYGMEGCMGMNGGLYGNERRVVCE